VLCQFPVSGARLTLQVLRLDDCQLPFGILQDEDEVNYANYAFFFKIGKLRDDLATELVPGKLYYQVVHRTITLPCCVILLLSCVVYLQGMIR